MPGNGDCCPEMVSWSEDQYTRNTLVEVNSEMDLLIASLRVKMSIIDQEEGSTSFADSIVTQTYKPSDTILKEDERIRADGDTGQQIVDKMLRWLNEPGKSGEKLIVEKKCRRKPFYFIYNREKEENVFILQAHDSDTMSDYGLLFTTMLNSNYAKKWQKRKDMADGSALGWTTSISSRSNSKLSYRKKKDLRDGTFGDFENELKKLL